MALTAAERKALQARVADINGIYNWATGKSLSPEGVAADLGEKGGISSLTNEDLQLIVSTYGDAAERMKAAIKEYEASTPRPTTGKRVVQDPNNPFKTWTVEEGVAEAKAWDQSVKDLAFNTFNDVVASRAEPTTPAQPTPVPTTALPSGMALPHSSSYPDSTRTPAQPNDISGLVNQRFAPQYDSLYRDVAGAASKRGGLDSGGFLTSLSKGTALLNAQKAGEQIDWDKFLKSLELPTAQFDFAKNVQFPESVREWNKGFGLQTKQYNTGVSQYNDQMKALQDLYASQNKTNWYDPILQVIGYAAGGFAGGVGGAAAKAVSKNW